MENEETRQDLDVGFTFIVEEVAHSVTTIDAYVVNRRNKQ
jgi:hypothetical protein